MEMRLKTSPQPIHFAPRPADGAKEIRFSRPLGISLLAILSLLFGCSTSGLHPASRAPSSIRFLSSSKPKRVLIPIPHEDFDPTEAAVPWSILKAAGDEVIFATPDGQPGAADPAEVTGQGLGLLSNYIAANHDGREAYHQLTQSEEFKHPLAWSELKVQDYDAIYLPGGHSPGMQPYLHSKLLQNLITDFFAADKPVGAICHGVLLVARSKDHETGKSVLFGRKTTSLTNFLELTGFNVARLTGARVAAHFRTDPQTVEDQVKTALASPADYQEGPKTLFRDSARNLDRGFYVQDGNYLSARWPGDAFRFGTEFAKLVATYQPGISPRKRLYYLPARANSLHVRVGELIPRGKIQGDILYLHGFADRLDNHAPLFDEWIQRGFRVIAFDMPSHGETYGLGNHLGSFTVNGIENLARQVELKTQTDSNRPLLLAGWSTGGLVAARMIDPADISKLSRRPSGVILFAPGISLKKLVGEYGIVTTATLTSNPAPPHVGPIKPISPLLYPTFALSMLYNARLARQVKTRLPHDLPILTFVSGVQEDRYVHADQVKKWVLSARRSGIGMTGFECAHSFHELDNEPAPVGPEVREIAGRFASEVVRSRNTPAAAEISGETQACRAF